jgi:CDGSH-type Zn-finger protein
VTTLTPVKFEADKTGAVWLCGCKQTAGQPFCDGTHKGL